MVVANDCNNVIFDSCLKKAQKNFNNQNNNYEKYPENKLCGPFHRNSIVCSGLYGPMDGMY